MNITAFSPAYSVRTQKPSFNASDEIEAHRKKTAKLLKDNNLDIIIKPCHYGGYTTTVGIEGKPGYEKIDDYVIKRFYEFNGDTKIGSGSTTEDATNNLLDRIPAKASFKEEEIRTRHFDYKNYKKIVN